MHAAAIRFLLDGQVISLDAVDPTLTALELLRGPLRRTGTKEGCGEGDCGACTIVVGELDGAQVRWRALNACLLFVPMLDGCAVLTVESLSRHGTLHPVQQAMLDGHGSQCGFCTPGLVMSLYARSIGALGTTGSAVADVIAGNLCRCTGYGPILDSATRIATDPASAENVASALAALRRDQDLGYVWRDPYGGPARRTFAPRSVAALTALLQRYPRAQLIAGASDVALSVNKQLRTLETTIFIAGIAELRQIDEDDYGLRLGAAVRYSEAQPALARLHPDLGELLRRIGAVQVRNTGTIGGNIGNASPIGDLPPALIALGARLRLRHGAQQRLLALEDYFIDYGHQDRRPGEFIEQLIVPRPSPHSRLHVRKLSKRADSDISAVCGAVWIELDGAHIRAARIAFGGMAATPRRAPRAEAALLGRRFDHTAIDAAIAALADDYQPLDDVRGSAGYRHQVAASVLRGLWLRERFPDQPISVHDLAHADG